MVSSVLQELVGATITAAREADWGDSVVLLLADGREVRLTAHSYEDAYVEVALLSPEERRREALVSQGRRERVRVATLQEKARTRTKEFRIAAARASMTPEDFGVWLDQEYGTAGTHAVLKQVYIGPLLEAMQQDAVLAFSRQAFGPTPSS